MQHIEKFGPILVEGLAKIVGAPKSRQEKASAGLTKLLGRDTKSAEAELEVAESRLAVLKAKQKAKLKGGPGSDEVEIEEVEVEVMA